MEAREDLRPDRRSAQRRGVTHESLRAYSRRWTSSDSVPPRVAAMLRVVKDLFAHGYFVYEFFTVAAVWSLLAVEAALRDRTGVSGRRAGLGQLIALAVKQGLLNEDDAEHLRAGTGLRNVLVHPKGHSDLGPGAASEIIESSFRHIEHLYGEGVHDSNTEGASNESPPG